MKKISISLSLIALLCANANAADTDVLTFDALGNNRISEYNICKDGVTAQDPVLTFSEDGTQMTITTINSEGTESSSTTTLSVNSICAFSKYYNGIGDDATDLQAPVKDETVNAYLIQNAGNFSSMINGIEEGTYNLGDNFLQTAYINCKGVSLGCVSKEFAGTYKLEQDTLHLDNCNLTECLYSADVFPFKTSAAYTKMNYRQANISLPSSKTPVVVDATFDGSTQAYTMHDVTFSVEFKLADQSPEGATSVTYVGDSKLSGEMSAGYTSFCLPFDLTKEEVFGNTYTYSKYTVKQEGDKTNCYVTFAEVDTSNGLAAGTPVVMKRESAGTWTVSLTGKSLSLTEPATSTTVAGLYGTYSEMSFTDLTAFGLNADGKTFELLDGTPAYYAYICIPKDTYSYYYAEFPTSGIEGVDADETDVNAIVDVYSTQGALVAKSIKRGAIESSLERGLYMLSNGEKVCVK